MKTYYRKLAVLFTEQVFMLILALIVNKIVAKSLPIDFLGDAAINFSVATTFYSFSLFGIPAVLLKNLNESYSNSDKSNVFFNAVIPQIGISLLLSFFLIIFLRSYLKIHWIIIYIIFSIIERNLEIYLFSFNSIKENSYANVISRIVKLLVLLLIINNFSLNAYLNIFILELLLKVIIKIYYSNLFRLNPNFIIEKLCFNKMKKNLIDGSSLLLVSFNELFIEYGDIYMIRFISGNYYVGLYDRIYQLFKKTFLFNQTLGKLNTQISSSNNNDINQLYRNNIFITVFLLIPIIFTMIIFSKELILFFLTSDYLIGKNALSILLIGSVIDSFSRLNGAIIIYRINLRIISKITLVGSITNILINLLLIPTFNINGAAIASTFSHFIMFLVSTYVISKNGVVSKKLVFITLIIVVLVLSICTVLILLGP